MHNALFLFFQSLSAARIRLTVLLCFPTACTFATEPRPHLLELSTFRQQIKTDAHLAALWEKLKQAAAADLAEPVWTPATPLPGREKSHVRRQNPNDGLIRQVGRRLERAALVYRLTGDERYLQNAWRQMSALFDAEQWPDWRDLAHRDTTGHSYVDLRSGDLSASLGITYDWLRNDLTAEQRAAFLAGVDRHVVRPFLRSVDQRVWWLDAGHNWTTRIVGGVGILGMALRDDDPRADRIVAVADRAMLAYLDHLGADGSFNESPGYVPDLEAAARYFRVRSYAQGVPDSVANGAIARLVRSVHWTVWTLLPGFRQIAFGDTKTKRPLAGDFAGAIAAASGDGLAQWLFLAGGELNESTDPRRIDPEAVLAYRPQVEPTPPSEVLPRARAYHEQGGILVSRTGWDLSANSSDVVVFGKHGREANHDHDDVGQVTMTRGTQAIVAETGNNFTYPSDFFGPNRRAYYPAAARGHNVITFGEADDGGMLPDGRGELLHFEHGDDYTHWKIKLSKAYGEGRQVTREVVHLLPGALVVLDEVKLPRDERITLRWHTGAAPTNQGPEQFGFQGDGFRAALHVATLVGEPPTLNVDRHAFHAPFDTGRDELKLPQHHEPFVAVTTKGDQARWLSIVVATNDDQPPTIEKTNQTTWKITTKSNQASVRVTPDGLTWQ